MPKYTDYRPRYRHLSERVQVRVQGPRQQQSGSDGFWAGAFTPDELEHFGVELIQVAAEQRKQMGSSE